MSDRALSSLAAIAAQEHSLPSGWRGFWRRLKLRLIAYLVASLQEPERPAQTRSAECLDLHDFETRLKLLFAGRTTALAGRLHFVNLAEIRAHYGARWASVSATVYRIVSRIIEENIGPRDFFIRTGDAYMIVFPDLTPGQAEQECARIALRIRTALVAVYPEAPPLEVRHVIEVLDGGFKLAPMEAATIRPPERCATAGRHIADTREIDAGVASAFTALMPKFDYRPIWNTKLRQVSSYACLPAGPLPATDGATRAECDRRCLEKIIGDATWLMAMDGHNANIIFPVHFATLMDPDLRAMFERAAKAVPPELKDRLVAEIVDVPAALERAEILRLKSTLGSVCQAMVARVPLGVTRFRDLKPAGFSSVGLDISGYAGPEAKIQGLLDDHVEEAGRLALKTYVHGLRSVSMITHAVCAGIDHIDGEPISALDSRPIEIYPLDPKHLYNHLRTDSAADRQ